MPGPDLLARIDRIMAALLEVRSELAASEPPDVGRFQPPDDADDLSPEHLLDTTSAAARFNFAPDTIRLWARQGCGVKRGGRWLISIPRLQRRLNGG